MMRILTFLLLVATLVLGVWSFVDYEGFLLGPTPANQTWWWPQEISTYGQDIDALFNLIAGMVAFMYVVTMGALAWFVLKFSAKREDKAVFSHGSHKLELFWTAVPAALLLVIAFSQMSTFASIQFKSATYTEAGEPIEPFAEIFASQFDWRYRYPGPDGRFGTNDDIETEYELVLPMMEGKSPEDRKLVFHLRSRDVLHSFFVPMLRFKRDAVPGMTQRIWFSVDQEQHDAAFAGREDKSFDIICAELCGWGHYKMAGRIRVLPDEEFKAWMAEQVAKKYGND